MFPPDANTQATAVHDGPARRAETKPATGQIWRQTDLKRVKRFVRIEASSARGQFWIREVVRRGSRGWVVATNARLGKAPRSRFVGPDAGYELHQERQS